MSGACAEISQKGVACDDNQSSIFQIKVLDQSHHHCVCNLGRYCFGKMPKTGDQITLLYDGSFLSFELIRYEHQPLPFEGGACGSREDERQSGRTVLLVARSARRTTSLGEVCASTEDAPTDISQLLHLR